MLRAPEVLEAAVKEGLALSWKRTRTKEYKYNVTAFNVTSDLFSMSDETYGRTSVLYFYCKSPDIAWRLVTFLRTIGCKPGTGWNGGPDKGCVELPVGYFKGHHWYE